MLKLTTRESRTILVEGTETEIRNKVFASYGSYLYPFKDENEVNDSSMFDSPFMREGEKRSRVTVLPQDVETYTTILRIEVLEELLEENLEPGDDQALDNEADKPSNADEDAKNPESSEEGELSQEPEVPTTDPINEDPEQDPQTTGEVDQTQESRNKAGKSTKPTK